MIRRTERILENIPVGSLGLVALEGCEELGRKVDEYLVRWRHEANNEYRDDIAFPGYEKDTYLIKARVPRFGSGEAKGILGESVRGKDLYLMVDVCNYSVTYSLTGRINHMSPMIISRTLRGSSPPSAERDAVSMSLCLSSMRAGSTSGIPANL